MSQLKSQCGLHGQRRDMLSVLYIATLLVRAWQHESSSGILRSQGAAQFAISCEEHAEID